MKKRFASQADYAECKALHRRFGTTYYFATKQFPREVQKATHAVYGFVRVPDEWVDNPGALTPSAQAALLQDWRKQLLEGVQGVRPKAGVMRAFVDTITERQIPVEEPLLFLDAMEMDLAKSRYDTYAELESYMRGSAAAVGAMMLAVLEPRHKRKSDQQDEKLCAAKALGDAMQLTNFIRDVAEDAARGRVYLPLEDLDRFGVTENQILEARFDPRLERLVRFQIARARALYAKADIGIRLLDRPAQRAVLLARVLYSRILDRVEDQGANPFAGRARTSTPEKLVSAAAVVLAPGWTLDNLAAQRPAGAPALH